MINLLNASTDKLQLVTGAAATLHVIASWVDLNADGTGDPSMGRTPTAISTATTTDIVATPAASKVRNVKEITVYNYHATLTCDVTPRYNANATTFDFPKFSLAPGESLEYIEGIGWFKLATGVTPVPANFSVAAQVLTAATLTQLVGSSIAIPSGKLRIGTILRWKFDITKTAAGTASSAYHVRIGTANSTADTAVLTFTKIAGTAVVDTANIEIEVIIRGPLSTLCIAAGRFTMMHNLAATGHSTLPGAALSVVSSGFDATIANLFASISATTGASDAITIQTVDAEAQNL